VIHVIPIVIQYIWALLSITGPFLLMLWLQGTVALRSYGSFLLVSFTSLIRYNQMYK